MSKYQQILIVIGLFVFFLGAYVLLVTPKIIGHRSTHAPNISLPLLDNPQKNIVLADVLSNNAPLLVNIWASWCSSCLQEHGFLLKLSKNMLIVGIAGFDGLDAARAYLHEHHNPFGISLLDKADAAVLGFGIRAVPETFLIAADGKILAHFAGILNDRVFAKVFAPHL